ncbi:Uncharacterised protein [Mycolicibacterium aurum]|uniref:Transmembrane protein n=1 Tax=Mycolicibacterium aurum TaxID=1791 RepID=A0A3S4VIU1_MYCAU|nr:hypothetical protein [Mycolicibacterium aurum]VEG52378.1 Uncharacterised protein [Mycolicibacterium aurum]
MVSSVIAAAVVLALAIWHLLNSRHPGWDACSEGRSYLLSGYSVVASSMYWLFTPPRDAWEWIFAAGWLVAGIVAFVLGFNALNRAAGARVATRKSVEANPASEKPRQTSGI